MHEKAAGTAGGFYHAEGNRFQYPDGEVLIT
jgi:hypothetical protein